MREFVVRVVAPWFVAGVIVRDGAIVEAAPILTRTARAAKWNGRAFVLAARARGWSVEIRPCAPASIA